ncbi:hypothetical protein AYK26_06535 [Euryarchaeota archaeon SM23-78]|nr:MAG: hypothetical protein AYK26_06535 [Euryarchaeota archaeon SM23-78]MBW3000603.1 hypothetical protein [Candidatus Woesearchaeota archaeon]
MTEQANEERGKRKRGRPPKKKPGRKPNKKKKLRKIAPKEKYFILCNGKPVKNIKELADILEELEDNVFNHHVRVDGNDFAKWVEDIFKDVELAEKIAGVKDKKHMQLVIYKHITHKLW